MFPYDAAVATALQTEPQSIADVLSTMRTIDSVCSQGDGLKWFNWLYLQVTQAVEDRVASGGFSDPAWLSELDVRFATLYFNALKANAANQACPGCWAAVFAARDKIDIARIQFALAGMNAHINHDLPLAILSTWTGTQTEPHHSSPQYNDYTGLNTAMDALIDEAKKTLNVRLLGDPFPEASHVEDTIAAWNLATAREKAWDTAESLWASPSEIAATHMDVIDGLTTVISKVLLTPAS